MSPQIFNISTSSNDLTLPSNGEDCSIEHLTLESYIRSRKSEGDVIMGKKVQKDLLKNTVYTVIYVHGKAESTPTKVDLDAFRQHIKENMRASFEIEGHSISDDQWKKILNSDKYLRLDYI